VYEDDIKTLENMPICGVKSVGVLKAVTTAIALMHAAKPLDDDAEREHCEEVADDPGCEVEPCVIKTYARRIERERAAARAPLQLEINRLRSAITNACNALSVDDAQGGTAEAVVAELQAVLKGAPPKARVRLGQALDEFVTDVAEALKKGRDK
jgi:hypothetical protein